MSLSSHRATFALCLAAVPGLLRGQAAPEVIELERMEVSAQKRVQAIQDVPIALNAYSGTFLETAGIAQYKDLAPLVPGLFVQQQSPNFPGINIRGVTSDSTDPRSETRVSIFQDGVSISRATGSTVELFDLERVEVLKGPQGTLFGRGAEVGAISIIQRKPSSATEGSLTAGFGNFAERRLEGFYNTALGSDSLLGRVAFLYGKRDGTVDNLAGGPALNSRDTLAIRPSFRWLPGERTTVDVILNYQRDQPTGTPFRSGVIPTRRGDTNPFAAAELDRGDQLRVDRSVVGGTLIVTHELNEAWTLTGITGVREFDSHEEFDADGSRLFLLALSDRSTGEQFSQELRANFDRGGSFAGFVGVNYFREKGNQRISLYTDERQVWPFLSGEFRNGLIANGVPAFLANAAVPLMNPFLPQNNLPAGFAVFANLPPPLSNLAFLANAPLKGYHTEQYANTAESSTTDLFADGTFRINDRFEITAGVRLSYDDQTGGYQAWPAAVPSTLGFLLSASPNLAFAPTNGLREGSVADTSVVGRLIGRFVVNKNNSTYASISRGRRPAGIAVDSPPPFTVSTISEEVIWNYEVGLKGATANRRFDYNAALFHYDYSDFQTTVRDPNNAARFISVSAGNATGRGGELALRARLADTFSAFTTYGYTDATFDDVGENGEPQLYAGSSFRLTSKHTFALGATYTVNSESAGRFSLTPIYQYKSEHYFDDDNPRFGGTLRQDGFGLVNVRANWRSPRSRWEVAAYAENLLDEDYLIDAGNFGANFGIPTFIRGQPRLYGMSATARF